MYCWHIIQTQWCYVLLTDHTDTVMLCTADISYRHGDVMYCWHIIQTQWCYVLLTDHTDTVMLCTTDESYTQCRYGALIDPTDTVLTKHSWPAHCLWQHVISPTQEHLASKHTLYHRLPLESLLRKYTAFTPLQPSLVTSISVSSLHYIHAVQVTQVFWATFTLHSNSVVRSPVLKSQLFPPVFC